MPFLIPALRRTVVSVRAVTVFFLAPAVAAFLAGISFAQNAAPAANSDPNYQALRNLTLSGEAVSVTNFELKRDAGTFHLHSGTVCFAAPVNGKVTAAVFAGDGNFVLTPPTDTEKKSLKLLTKENEFSENFNQMVLRFTDSTYDEIKKGGAAGASGCDAGPLKDSQHTTRHKLRDNLEARILQDVLSPEPGGLFVAFIHGKRYNGQELYTIDPHEGRYEQLQFVTYDENKLGQWAAFPMSDERKGEAGQPIRIEHQQLDTTFEKSANLIGKAKTTFPARRDGLRVVPFDLFRSLRVRSVHAEDGQALAFIQEDKNDDANFAVILPKALNAGERYTVATEYQGKEAVTNEGGGNYFPNPAARGDWYPNNPASSSGEYVSYDMTFRIPKGMQIAASGVRVSDNNEGGQNVTVWRSEAPQNDAGFNFGRFKLEEAKLDKPQYLIQSYANQEVPDSVVVGYFAFSFSARLAIRSSSRIAAMVLGPGNAKNCKMKPKMVRMNPRLANQGSSRFTIAAGRACSHSGHELLPYPRPIPPLELAMKSALVSTHRADLPSLVLMSRKLEDVA